MPSLLNLSERVIPGKSIGTTISDLLLWGLVSDVLARRQMKSA